MAPLPIPDPTARHATEQTARAMSFDVEQLDLFLLVGSGVAILAIFAVRVSSRAGLPSLLIYLLMGVLLGESVLGIAFEDAAAAHAIGFGALAIILAEGGLTTNWREARPTMRLGFSLATVGVAVSVGVMALGAHLLLGLPWELAVLLGAVCSPTDAAAVFSVLRTVPLPRRLVGALEAESGLNDAPTVVLVTLLASGGLGEHHPVLVVLIIIGELAGGVLIGLALGWVGSWSLRHAALPTSGLYPLAVLMFCFLSYGVATAVHTSGFAAIYVAGVVLGNSSLPHRGATRSFSEGIAWLAQIGLFVMLGLLLSPGRIDLHTVYIAVGAGILLSVVARPLSVWFGSLGEHLSWREQAFVSWAGLRGAVPIVLTTIPLAEGFSGANELFDIVFVIVVIDTLLTGPTLPWVAKVLRIVEKAEPRDLDLEAAPLERVAADLIQLTINQASRMHGVEVGELRLPRGASVSLIVRDGTAQVPERGTVLRRGDDLLVVTPRRMREATEERLRLVSERGRLAHWLDDE